jgi:hypothetical protein
METLLFTMSRKLINSSLGYADFFRKLLSVAFAHSEREPLHACVCMPSFAAGPFPVLDSGGRICDRIECIAGVTKLYQFVRSIPLYYAACGVSDAKEVG